MFTQHTSIKSSLFALSVAGLSLGLVAPANAENNATPQDWAVSASYLVQGNMSYPNMAEYRGESGTAYVRVTIDSDGTVQNIRLTETSGSKRLDKAAMETIESLGQFPATNFTSDQSTTFTVGLNYVLENGMRHTPSNATQNRGHVKARDVADAGSNDTYASISFQGAEG
ncbi:MAG: energy transducer TonB [Alphaproteobacteria bacterium]|nr:MAG: energy transducer TonB [Alphaproteobacteria bacterium]